VEVDGVKQRSGVLIKKCRYDWLIDATIADRWSAVKLLEMWGNFGWILAGTWRTAGASGCASTCVRSPRRASSPTSSDFPLPWTQVSVSPSLRCSIVYMIPPYGKNKKSEMMFFFLKSCWYRFFLISS
jgi:hypothetical protein